MLHGSVKTQRNWSMKEMLLRRKLLRAGMLMIGGSTKTWETLLLLEWRLRREHGREKSWTMPSMTQEVYGRMSKAGSTGTTLGHLLNYFTMVHLSTLLQDQHINMVRCAVLILWGNEHQPGWCSDLPPPLIMKYMAPLDGILGVLGYV